MNVLTESNLNPNFTRASEIKIPDIYNRRFLTGLDDFDEIFGGQGFLPGMAITLASAPGCGKTSIFLQILDALEAQGKKTAYISGEEGVEQLAFTCKRLNVHAVPLANITDIDLICNEIQGKKLDMVVLDSLPSLQIPAEHDLHGRAKEEYMVSKIIQTAKEQECVIAVIMHFTKTGTYKGSTLLPHSVDCNMIMTRNKEDEDLRDLDIVKNRFGSSGNVTFGFGKNGFDFRKVDVELEEKSPGGKSKGPSANQRVMEAIAAGASSFAEISRALDNTVSSVYLQSILRDLQSQELIVKSGRGAEARYAQAIA